MRPESAHHIQLLTKSSIRDVIGERVSTEAGRHLGLKTGSVRSAKIFTVVTDIPQNQLQQFSVQALQDPLLHDLYVDRLYQEAQFQSYLLISKLPGVTDDEGISAQKTFCDFLNIEFNFSRQFIFTQDIFYIENELSEKQLYLLAADLLGNPLVNHFEYGRFEGQIGYVPEVHLRSKAEVRLMDIFVSDDELLRLSKDYLLALDLKEMKAIQAYFAADKTVKRRAAKSLNKLPTDCEIEVLAQTWSEHCKHKEFDADIHFTNLETGQQKTIHSLFKTYIKRSTEIIRQRYIEAGNNWLLKIFSDNAGVVRIDDENVFIWKVETHNSPSALDPYGGALTGIVGVNRDPLGTGVGGGKLLFNTNVLCFGRPDYAGELLPGQLHPRRIMSGVVKGIEDGGNKSGIPTVNGSIIFDDRFRGKPLVFCGTGAVMPAQINGKPSWEKPIDPGDRIIMAGGRVGKDGIHGATFSSLEIDEHSPRSAVQIGSPITQKNMADFMQQAVGAGLIKCSTDNGAGGLSSSIGELATISGGARVDLEKVPLKYSGLQPWEIFVSESQERMTLVVESEQWAALKEMAHHFEVELSDIGEFTASGDLEVCYEGKTIALIGLDFLHDGVPKKELFAEWKKPQLSEPALPQELDYTEILLRLLSDFNISSREDVIRRYDHEVKGKSIIKPLMGEDGQAAQDAAVMRINFKSMQGIAISNGLKPRFGDTNAYHMAAGAFDEAVRSIISVGGRLPDPTDSSNRFWTVNDNFCVPDSVYHPQTNPDGKYKMAQLIMMNEALFDLSTTFNIPMTSGKDSMKNDFVRDGVKISVPPTLLFSMVAKIDDVRKTITAEFKAPDDLLFLLGQTYNELGGSEFYQLFGHLGANVPQVRPQQAMDLYKKIGQAQEAGLILSSHDLSDGGLAVALAVAAFGGNLGCIIDLPETDLSLPAQLFSESHSRFVVSIDPQQRGKFEAILGSAAAYLGKVEDDQRFLIRRRGKTVVETDVPGLKSAWRGKLKL